MTAWEYKVETETETSAYVASGELKAAPLERYLNQTRCRVMGIGRLYPQKRSGDTCFFVCF